MTINIEGFFSARDMSPSVVRIEPGFDEVTLTGQVDEEFEDLHASPFANPLLEKTRGYFEL